MQTPQNDTRSTKSAKIALTRLRRIIYAETISSEASIKKTEVFPRYWVQLGQGPMRAE